MDSHAQDLYPLELSLYRLRKPWGGWPGRIAEVLSLSGPPHESVVLNGSLLGWRLTDLVGEYQEKLLGRGMELDLREPFPFRLRFISAAQDLPVEVCPDEAYAMRAALPFVSQEKIWLILKAAPDAFIYLGWREDMDLTEARKALGRGALRGALNAVRVRAGELYTVPAGRVHGLGRGVAVFEVARHTDLCFGMTLQARRPEVMAAHRRRLEAALEVADLRGLQPSPVPRMTRAQGEHRIDCLALTPRFVSRRLVIRGRLDLEFHGHRFAVYTGLRGSGWLGDGSSEDPARLEPYQSVLVPGRAGELRFQSRDEVQVLETAVTDMAGGTLKHFLDLGASPGQIAQLGGHDYSGVLRNCMP